MQTETQFRSQFLLTKINFITKIPILVVAVIIGACTSKSFQPLPPMFKSWKKEGVTPEDTKLALLQCGYDNPYTGFDTNKSISLNDLAHASKCMRDSGFLYLPGTGKIICDHKEWINLPACQEKTIPNNEPPQRQAY